jgi:hypothetical protein
VQHLIIKMQVRFLQWYDFCWGSSYGVYCINNSQTWAQPGLLFAIARIFAYTHSRHLWNTFKDRPRDVGLCIEIQIKLHGTGGIKCSSYFNFFSFFVLFPLRCAGGADVCFVLSLSAVMFSNTGEPVTHWP